MSQAERGRVFREAWIAGVKKHYPGEPKAGYIASGDETPGWERESATAVSDQVRTFVEVTDGQTARPSRMQKGPLRRHLLDRPDLQALPGAEAVLCG